MAQKGGASGLLSTPLLELLLLLQAAFGLGAHRRRHSLRVGLDSTLDYLRLVRVLDDEADARF